MKKNNRGFTLVELLAIVILLAVIAIIAAPNIANEIQRNEEENQNVLNEKIENAAHLYAAKYYANDLVDGESIEFTLEDLQNDGLINLNGNCSGVLENKITISPGNGYDYSKIVNNDCYQQEEN